MDTDVDAEALNARLGALYREIAVARHELVTLLKERARGPVDDVTLAGPEGPVRLSALFGDRDQLIVSFNLGSHSRFCTLWADDVAGVVRQIEQVAAFVVVSPEPPAAQAAFARSRGWPFRMVSHAGTSFAADQGFTLRNDAGDEESMPGVATYRRGADGAIERIAMDLYGPGDPYCSVFHFLALLDGEVDFSPSAP